MDAAVADDKRINSVEDRVNDSDYDLLLYGPKRSLLAVSNTAVKVLR